MRRALLLLLAASCGGGADVEPPASASAAPWLVESAAERGLRFHYRSGAAGELLMPEIMGGGAALFDMDGDADLDAYLVQAGAVRGPAEGRPPNQLFANDGSGSFEDVTDGSGAGDRGYGMGVACGDADGDGDPELYVTNWGPNALLANEGGGRFRDVTSAAGVGHAGWGASAAFLDADLDGDLDLYVVNYIVWGPDQELACSNDMGTADYCSPTSYGAPALDAFYRNAGDGTFTDATRASGVGAVAANGLGVACADFDGDGWTDVFVANDQNPDLLWRNREGSFVDEAFRSGCALDRDGQAKAGMGVAVADVDEDGDEDLIVCNLNRESDSFFENRGDGIFADRTARAGLARRSRSFTRFGMGWADFDDDGRLDLYQANGRVMQRMPRYAPDDGYAEPNLLFRGLAGGGFEAVEPRGGTASPAIATSRAAAFGDVDGDGGVDVLVVNRDGPAHLFLNRVPGRGNWIGLRAVDARGGDVLHARVMLRAGDRTITREVRTAYSYQAASSPVVHVGLGDAAGVSEVSVTWPGAETQAFGGFEAGRVHVLRRSE